MILGNMKLLLAGINGLTSKQNHVLNLLYGPLLHPLAYKLYHLLISFNDIVLYADYAMVADILDCDLEELEAARINCEKLGLMRTYHQQNHHQIELIEPKSVQDFLQNELFGRLYIKECGPTQLKLVSSMIKENTLNTDFDEISASISMKELSGYSQELEQEYRQEIKSISRSKFDLDIFLANTNEVLFPKSVRTQENLDLISSLAQQYQLTNDQLRMYVAKAMNKAGTKLNVNHLKELAGSQLIKITSEDSNPLKWSTPEFLQSKMGDVPVLESNLSTIDYLREKYRFNDQVLNVLIDYALTNNKGILARKYLDLLASAMHLNKVKTLEDAINHFAFNHKPKSKQVKSVIEFVDYNDKTQESESKQEDLADILKEFDE